MATLIQIVIVGLCTLMNVDNSDTKFLPPASVIIPRADSQAAHGGIPHPHIAFIAWDKTAVDAVLTGGITQTAVIAPAPSTTNFVYVALDGDEIQVKDLDSNPTAKLDLSGYSGIARHSEYWRYIPSPKTYDPNYVPVDTNRLGTPNDDFVAGYFRFGTGGTLTASHPTTQDWIFKDDVGSVFQGKLNQAVAYSYPATLNTSGFASVEIVLKDLVKDPAKAVPDRTIKLTSKVANASLRVYIGNGTRHGIYNLAEEKDPPESDQCPATHFKAIHMMAHTPDAKTWPYPEPVKIGKNCKGFHGDSSGYCGPDGKP